MAAFNLLRVVFVTIMVNACLCKIALFIDRKNTIGKKTHQKEPPSKGKPVGHVKRSGSGPTGSGQGGLIGSRASGPPFGTIQSRFVSGVNALQQPIGTLQSSSMNGIDDSQENALRFIDSFSTLFSPTPSESTLPITADAESSGVAVTLSGQDLIGIGTEEGGRRDESGTWGLKEDTGIGFIASDQNRGLDEGTSSASWQSGIVTPTVDITGEGGFSAQNQELSGSASVLPEQGQFNNIGDSTQGIDSVGASLSSEPSLFLLTQEGEGDQLGRSRLVASVLSSIFSVPPESSSISQGSNRVGVTGGEVLDGSENTEGSQGFDAQQLLGGITLNEVGSESQFTLENQNDNAIIPASSPGEGTTNSLDSTGVEGLVGSTRIGNNIGDFVSEDAVGVSDVRRERIGSGRRGSIYSPEIVSSRGRQFIADDGIFNRLIRKGYPGKAARSDKRQSQVKSTGSRKDSGKKVNFSRKRQPPIQPRKIASKKQSANKPYSKVRNLLKKIPSSRFSGKSSSRSKTSFKPNMKPDASQDKSAIPIKIIMILPPKFAKSPSSISDIGRILSSAQEPTDLNSQPTQMIGSRNQVFDFGNPDTPDTRLGFESPFSPVDDETDIQVSSVLSSRLNRPFFGSKRPLKTQSLKKRPASRTKPRRFSGGRSKPRGIVRRKVVAGKKLSADSGKVKSVQRRKRVDPKRRQKKSKTY